VEKVIHGKYNTKLNIMDFGVINKIKIIDTKIKI